MIPPWEDASAWDHPRIAGIEFSGRVTITGDGFEKKIDKRRAAGQDGGNIVDKGFELVEFTIELFAWETKHVDQMKAIVARLASRGRAPANRRAFDISHPGLALYGITQAYAKGGAIPQPTDDGLHLSIKCVEYHPPPPRNTTTRPAAAAQDEDDDRPAAIVNRGETIAAIPPPSTSGAARP